VNCVLFNNAPYRALIDSGLEQPVANWASTGSSTRRIGAMSRTRVEKGIPGCRASVGSKLLAHGSVDPPLYDTHITSELPLFTRSSCFLHLASSIFLQLASFIFPPTTHTGSSCAQISTQGYSGGKDLLGKGSGNLPNASGCGTINSKTKRRIWACVSLGGFPFLSFPIFLSFLVNFDICNILVLALENWSTIYSLERGVKTRFCSSKRREKREMCAHQRRQPRVERHHTRFDHLRSSDITGC